MASLISPIIVEDLRLFNQLVRRVEQAGSKYQTDVSTSLWREELGRLRVWTANVGAHQTGQSSLDFRLRDASHISEEVVKLLRDLSDVLEETLEFIDDDEEGNIEPEDLPPPDSDGTPMTGLQYFFEEIITIIKCLYQMAMLVRKPAQRDFMLKSDKLETAAFEVFDKNHARDKFPRAEKALTDSLGAANTRRRRYLKYRERHNAKLGKGLGDVQGLPETASKALSDTIVTEHKSPDDDPMDAGSVAGFSQTSYAPSLMNGGTMVVPHPPEESAGGKPFVCPYCFCIITIDKQTSWTRHIFQDLRPYTCTFQDCFTRQITYASRHEWFFHFENSHSISNLECPLCREDMQTPKQFERHVARHLEEFALFVLPVSEEDESDVDDKRSQNSDSASNKVSAEEEESIIMKCFCGFKLHDGWSVQCELCKTWQHVECYYFEKYEDGSRLDINEIDHACVDCRPRSHDKTGAFNRQRDKFDPLPRRTVRRIMAEKGNSEARR